MQRIGRYEILKELGRGAMGAVYQARDSQIGRTVAIKVILTANLSPDDLLQYKQRFVREAQAAGQMSHPGIVTIHDIAEDESGQPFLVMEFIEGQPLDKLMEAAAPGLLPLDRCLDIGIQVAQALDFAHRRGVVHRDVKPANILITEEGHCKIADFGIAKLSGMQMTQTGHLLGTPAYMSPEQFRGAAVDSRSDLFSLGAMLYWMLTGEKPFAGDSLTAMSFNVVFTAAQPIHKLNASLPADMDTVISRCLAKDPADRYSHGRELAADLEAIKNGRAITATPLPIVATQTANETVATARTTVATSGPAIPTAMTPAKPAEKTVPLTAPEKTVPLQHAEKIERTVAVPPLAAKKSRIGLYVGLAIPVLLIGLILAWWFWPGPQRQEVAHERTVPAKGKPREAEPTHPRAEPPPEPSVATNPPVSSPNPTRPKRQTTTPVANSSLSINCQHNFKDATIEILSDDKSIYRGNLRGQSQDLALVKIFQGTLHTSISIPAGQHVLRVHVNSKADNYDGEEQIGGNFPAEGSRSLSIEFGKGSAFGVVERKLALRWR